MRRYDQREGIKDLLPGREGYIGGTAADNRLFVGAVILSRWPILVGPGKENGWEICGIAPSFRSGLAVLSRAQVRFHDLAVKMPSRMGEHRQRHREPNEERQRADHQGDGDEAPPGP